MPKTVSHKKNLKRYILGAPKRYWQKNWWHKLITIICIFIAVSLGTMYGIARWYIHEQANQPYNLGASFVPDYASYLGLNPNQTLEAMLTDLHLSNIRLTSYWSDIETSPGVYNFSELDQEMAMAQAAHVPVNLSIGLRQPRWPECHMPAWAQNQPYSQWEPELMTFIQTVVNRYKNNPNLSSYELENEYFLKAFGTCTNYSRTRLVAEYNLVKKLDPKHPIVVARSNNALGTPIGQPTPDIFGVSVYKRVWDSTITHRYFEYPIPAWFYGFLAGTEQIIKHRPTIIHELQAEPWPPTAMLQASQAEQAKSMNATILKSRFQYGEATGIKTIDLWGAEWWYYEKVVHNNPSDWNVAQQEFAAAQAHNATLVKK
jgi:hypothetical protein